MTTDLVTPRSMKIRLSIMMFVQYFIQGCYLPVASVYVEKSLGFSGREVGLFGSALAAGPLLAPLVIGQLVDRHVATQRVLLACHATSGALMIALSAVRGFWPAVVLGTIYSILYVPSLMLVNSLSFAHLRDPDREWPRIRLWGTVGFVAPAWFIEMVWLRGLTGAELDDGRKVVFWLAGIVGLVMAGYALTLPDTPPDTNRKRRFAPAAALELMRFRYFAVLVVLTFLVSIVHKFYFVWNTPFLSDVLRRGGVLSAWEQRMSSIGQIAEVAVMAGLGLLITRLGFKWTMLIGIAAYFARCLIFVVAFSIESSFALSVSLACLGQALHGLCFGCFLGAGYMFVDRVSPKDVRGSMQNVYGTLVVGLGFFAGGYIAGEVGQYFTAQGDAPTARAQMGIESTAGLYRSVDATSGESRTRDWPAIWLTCGAMAAACGIAFLLLFPRRVVAERVDESKPENST